MRTIARSILVIAWLVAQAPTTTEKGAISAERNAVTETAPAVVAPVAPIPAAAAGITVESETTIEIESSIPEARPSKCGDLPRAPWNTCVALHDHEI